jgi:hypothetical protein
MNLIVGYLRNYIRSLNRSAFLLTTLLVIILIIINYTFGIEARIFRFHSWPAQTAGFFLLYAFTFSAGWLLQSLFNKDIRRSPASFYVLLLAAPAIFAAKVTFDWFPALFTRQWPVPWRQYGILVTAWPLKCLLVLALVTLVWKWARYPKPVAGTQFSGFDARPYLVLLLIMTPLLALAATQADFLHTYPKVQRLQFIDPYVQPSWPWKLAYELAYGIDFITIEFFFRGFLILAFVRYAGAAAILPMAAFYCSIHFGKPLFECITSYMGGIILGVIVFNTRTIWGGLIVHLGIAWLMEVAGYIAHLWR